MFKVSHFYIISSNDYTTFIMLNNNKHQLSNPSSKVSEICCPNPRPKTKTSKGASAKTAHNSHGNMLLSCFVTQRIVTRLFTVHVMQTCSISLPCSLLSFHDKASFALLRTRKSPLRIPNLKASIDLMMAKMILYVLKTSSSQLAEKC